MDFAQNLKRWIEERPSDIVRVPISGTPPPLAADMNHYCSHLADKDAVDKVLAKYGSFCIAGQNASAPYIRQQLERMGKPYVQSTSYAPEVLSPLAGKFE
jgi:hypothetical protein